MKKGYIEVGQISLFETSQVTNEKKEEIKKVEILLEDNKKLDPLENILNEYKAAAEKIIKLWGNRYSVTLGEEIIYFTAEGKEEYRTNTKRAILPLDEIIFSKYDEEVNQLQKDMLEEIKLQYDVDKVIKRYGDSSYIAITKAGKAISVNAKGWIIAYENKAKYREEDIINYKDEDVVIEVGSSVKVNYKEIDHRGKVVRIYGPGNETMNVVFNGIHTAFYKWNVQLINTSIGGS